MSRKGLDPNIPEEEFINFLPPKKRDHGVQANTASRVANNPVLLFLGVYSRSGAKKCSGPRPQCAHCHGHRRARSDDCRQQVCR